MAFKFWDFIKPKNGKTSLKEIKIDELMNAAQEYQIRELSFWVCVNMISNAIGRCEFRTFVKNQEVMAEEYHLWNIEPNTNQNSSVFLHKLIAMLCKENEALVIPTRRKKGKDGIVVADAWDMGSEYPDSMNTYKSVVVGDMTYEKTFREADVLHLKLNHLNIKPVLDAMYKSYARLVDAAVRAYEFDRGQHWKVHVSSTANGDKDFEKQFAEMINTQIKAFFNSGGSVLPEFDGYTYTDLGKNRQSGDTSDIQTLIEDIFSFTARCFLIPAVLVNGKIEGTKDANERFLSYCIDPICDQLQEEINRKRYTYEEWSEGTYLRIDSSSILHFDIFANAANVEKLVGSGAFTINDVRRAANQPRITEPWADEHYMTLNIARADEQTRKLTEGRENE